MEARHRWDRSLDSESCSSEGLIVKILDLTSSSPSLQVHYGRELFLIHDIPHFQDFHRNHSQPVSRARLEAGEYVIR